jgi:hypothetical protein
MQFIPHELIVGFSLENAKNFKVGWCREFLRTQAAGALIFRAALGF